MGGVRGGGGGGRGGEVLEFPDGGGNFCRIFQDSASCVEVRRFLMAPRKERIRMELRHNLIFMSYANEGGGGGEKEEEGEEGEEGWGNLHIQHCN